MGRLALTHHGPSHSRRAALNSISHYSSGRDNNFNLLRLVAAMMVLVSHSYALSTGNAQLEPLRASLGITIGELAVDIFFVTSGFLVTASLLTRRDSFEFFVARALRIYPGLWTALLLSTAAVGLWFTSLGLASFAKEPDTWRYVLKNAIMLRDAAYTLPGAFPGAPYRGVVNGSLWTLPLELRMYLILGGVWVGLRLLSVDAVRGLKLVCVLVGVGALCADAFMFAGHAPNLFVSLLAKFFMGAALRVVHDRVPASKWLFLTLLGAVVAASVDAKIFGLAYRFSIAYLVIYAALVPSGFIREFNRIGDYSYGIYIYAFPIQQALAQHWHGIGPLAMMACSTPITVAVAVASWHVVEKRSLGLKGRVGRLWPSRAATRVPAQPPTGLR